MSHTRGTFAALVDALVPETPELADRGEEHVPGGLAVGLEEAIIDRVNNFQEVDGGVLGAAGYDATPMAPAVAVLLDTAAAELLVRRRSEDGFNSPAEAFAGGPFSRLSREDRLRALRLLEDEGVFPRLADRFDSAALGTIQFLASSLPILVEFVYYSEATADDGEERSLGWQQADYPGPADGYPVGMGYEIEDFEENDY
ncbi:hypothetical protein KY092_19225 [Natronomonas gomsonensis]|uniref:hypothetical protein n=1 Tax=Natronomonas gomsonensis TaxID=1046043 RepID=UPI0020CA93D4|nr:hypothetical protein [Natronomonas gomsonensis]MCY4732676.1 hypothetical protein [Natronomonas gomsonensis]